MKRYRKYYTELHFITILNFSMKVTVLKKKHYKNSLQWQTLKEYINSCSIEIFVFRYFLSINY